MRAKARYLIVGVERGRVGERALEGLLPGRDLVVVNKRVELRDSKVSAKIKTKHIGQVLELHVVDFLETSIKGVGAEGRGIEEWSLEGI